MTTGGWDEEQRPFVNDDQSGVERDAFGRDDRGRRRVRHGHEDRPHRER